MFKFYKKKDKNNLLEFIILREGGKEDVVIC